MKNRTTLEQLPVNLTISDQMMVDAYINGIIPAETLNRYQWLAAIKTLVMTFPERLTRGKIRG